MGSTIPNCDRDAVCSMRRAKDLMIDHVARLATESVHVSILYRERHATNTHLGSSARDDASHDRSPPNVVLINVCPNRHATLQPLHLKEKWRPFAKDTRYQRSGKRFQPAQSIATLPTHISQPWPAPCICAIM